MKEAAGVLIVMGLFIGMSALAVEAFDDRELFVSPPDAVAEGFIREVSMKRWPRAKEYLADPESMPEDEMRKMQAEIGEGQNIEAEIVTKTKTRAVVTVRVPSKHWVKKFALTFDGEWKVVVSS